MIIRMSCNEINYGEISINLYKEVIESIPNENLKISLNFKFQKNYPKISPIVEIKNDNDFKSKEIKEIFEIIKKTSLEFCKNDMAMVYEICQRVKEEFMNKPTKPINSTIYDEMIAQKNMKKNFSFFQFFLNIL